jgi:hypothetical protein
MGQTMKPEQIKGAFGAAVVGSWSAREITEHKAKVLIKLASELPDESWLRFYSALNYAMRASERAMRRRAR